MAKISLPCLVALVVSVLRVPESCFGRSISGDSKAGAFYYLVNFGYIEGSKNEDTAALMTESVLTKAIKRFHVCHTLSCSTCPSQAEVSNTNVNFRMIQC